MMGLPTGTVHFLFTDIESSTKIWEQHPERMRGALARHDFLLRTVLEANSGIVFKTVGDAFYAVFVEARDALKAAFEAQQTLWTERWTEIGEETGSSPITAGETADVSNFALRVRIALHTGTAEIRDNDYFGRTLNRIARLLAIGHGGQILITQATKDLVGNNLPAFASLRSMGEHYLRDLALSEQVYQLLHPELPSEFPPLRSLNTPRFPNNLHQQLTSFIGRDREVAEVKKLLTTTRLLTLTGSGGCGKTRVSLQVAEDLLEDYPDGVWLVELAPLSEPSLVPRKMASVLDVREQTGESILLTLTEHLRAKHVLLVLDNCEHLLDACAHLASTLLRQCIHVKILASSREALRIEGEQSYRVPSLSLPDRTCQVTLENLSDHESMRLFIDRAVRSRSDFKVEEEDVAALTSVCCRLDGIPLALELAAARVRSLSLQEINARLDDPFRLLTGGSRTALPRQQTLRALIDWSHNLLNPSERALLRRLSVFSGGWTLAAAEYVCADEGAEPFQAAEATRVETGEIFDLLISLVDKSLVQIETQIGQTRYYLLETVRQYSREKRHESGEGDRIRARHLDHFLGFAEETYPKLYGLEQGLWFHAIEVEHDNMRTALAWCAEVGAGEAELRLVGALGRFWDTCGYLHEGRERLFIALSHAPEPGLHRAKALMKAGWIAYLLQEFETAKAHYEEALAIYRTQHYPEGAARALHLLAMLARSDGNLDRAKQLFEEVLEINLLTGAHDGSLLSNLGWIAHKQGNLAEARHLLERALEVYRQDGHIQHIAATLRGLGRYALQEEDTELARNHFVESLRLFQSIGAKVDLLPTLEDFAKLAFKVEQWERAGKLWGAIEALYTSLNLPLTPEEKESITMAWETINSKSGGDAWVKGRAMTLYQAIDFALIKE